MIFEANDPNTTLAELEILKRTDDFSVQFVHERDSRFRLRFEDSKTPGIVVSDFFFGKLSDGELALILASVIGSLDNAATQELSFLDVEPGGMTNTRARDLRVYLIVDRAASLNTQLVTAISEKNERGKRNLSFTLSRVKNAHERNFQEF